MAIDRVITFVLIGILAFVIVDDVRNYRIKNSIVMMLLCICVIELLIKVDLRQLVAHTVFAAVAFGVLLLAFQRGWLGGGDTKLLTIAFLGIGPESGLIYAIFFLLLTLIYWGGAKLGVLPSRIIGGRLTVPFGPSIAGAWIATIAAVALQNF